MTRDHFNNHCARITGLKAIAFAILCILVSPLNVHAITGDMDGSFGLDGSIRTIPVYTDYTRLPSFVTKDTDSDQSLQTLLRLTAGGRPSGRLSYEVHLVQEFIYASNRYSGTSFSFPLPARYQALDASWSRNEQDHVSSRLWFDRFNIKCAFDRADVIVGRQAVTFGKAYFWNPLDVFFPFEPQQIDRDYKPGVDALRVDIPFGNFSGCNLVTVFGPKVYPENRKDKTWESSSYGSALLARVYTTTMDWDLALQGGKIYGGYQIGGGTVGEIEKIEARLEVAYFDARDSDPLPFPLRGYLFEDHMTLVAGIGRTFENSFVMELEYLYNGAGSTDDLAASFIRSSLGSSLHMGEHLLGLLFSYDILPIFVSRVVGVYSFSDQSALIQPTFFLSLADEVDLLFGATISMGDRPALANGIPILKSEFGTYPDFYFAELKYYF